jgi:hypothetical protein
MCTDPKPRVIKTYLPKIKIFRVKNRDRKPQFFDKHLSKTRKVQFRILMRSNALWYSDHSSSGSHPLSPCRLGIKPVFHLAELCARSGIFLCLVISRVELIRKDKERFRSARKIPPSGKPALGKCLTHIIVQGTATLSSEQSIVYHPIPELLHHLNYARAVSDFILIYLSFLLWYVK